MTTLILNGSTVLSLALDPNWSVPQFVTVDNHNYETRSKQIIGDISTYILSDSGVIQ